MLATGANRSGSTNCLPSASNRTSPAAASSPAPTRPPVKACVVDTGIPIRVAINTVPAAARLTASRNRPSRVTSSGTSPFPLNVSMSPWARSSAHSDPARVVTVAQTRAVR